MTMKSNRAARSQHSPTSTLTPAVFRATHPDVTAWSATDWETFQNLAEIAVLKPAHDDPPPPDSPAALALYDIEAAFALWEAAECVRVEAELDLAWAEL